MSQPASSITEAAAVWRNPIALAHGRPQLRRGGLVGWSVVTVSVVGFIFFFAYLTLTQRGEVDQAAAARWSIGPLIVLQCIILMGLGTAAVAAGIVKDREAGTMDYHRMTPMPAHAKILGYLFGLPARAYFLFALTLPFLAYAVWRGGVAPLRVLHFYAVFFSSVWMYHLFGLMAGMIAKKPKQSTLVSSGLVVALYLVVPGLARLGLSFLEFLTVRPTFYGMVAQEVQEGAWSQRVEVLTSRFAAVQFYGFEMNPTLFSLIVQGLAIAALVHVVRRKWTDPSWHAMSKRFSLMFFVATAVLLLGSLWPHLQGRAVYDRMNLQSVLTTDHGALLLMGAVFCGVVAAAALFCVSMATPRAVIARRGLRRARKDGLDRVPRGWDAASSLPLAAGVLSVGAAGMAAAAAAWNSGERAALGVELWPWAALLLALAVGVVLTFQALHERLGRVPVLLLGFVAWALPFMVAIVLVAAFGQTDAAIYAAVPCAPATGVLALMELTVAFGDVDLGQTLGREVPAARFALIAGVVLYAVLAVVTQVWRWRWARSMRDSERDVLGGAGDRGHETIEPG